jgi:hypothetical protein
VITATASLTNGLGMNISSRTDGDNRGQPVGARPRCHCIVI